MIESQINKHNDVIKVLSVGIISRYIGFSHKYFGKNMAATLVQQYDKEMTQFLQDPSINCTGTPPTYSSSNF